MFNSIAPHYEIVDYIYDQKATHKSNIVNLDKKDDNEKDYLIK